MNERQVEGEGCIVRVISTNLPNVEFTEKAFVEFYAEKWGYSRHPQGLPLDEKELERFIEVQFKMVEGITVCEGEKEYEHYIDFSQLAKAICQKFGQSLPPKPLDQSPEAYECGDGTP